MQPSLQTDLQCSLQSAGQCITILQLLEKSRDNIEHENIKYLFMIKAMGNGFPNKMSTMSLFYLPIKYLIRDKYFPVL